MVSGRIAETERLITDLNMPGMSGLELQAHLRSAGHRTPIIIVTAYLQVYKRPQWPDRYFVPGGVRD